MNLKIELKRIFLFFSIGNAYFYSVYTFILFISYFINDRGFPLFRSFLIFWFSAIITKILVSKKKYIIEYLFYHSIGYILASSWILSIFYESTNSKTGILWALSILTSPQTIVERAVLILIFFGISLLWIFGMQLGRKSISYEQTVQNFERGIFVFFFIAMMTNFLKSNIPQMNLYLLTFFLWSILSVSLCKSNICLQGINTDNGGIKLIFFFIIVLFIFILSIITFFIDSLEWAAVQGVSIIKTVTSPLVPYLISILKFLFGRRSNRILQDNNSISPNIVKQITDANSLSADTPSYKFLIIFITLIGVLILLFMLIELFKILFKKIGGVSENISFREILQVVFKEIYDLIKKVKNFIKTFFLPNKGRMLIIEIYLKLIRWGTIRGIYHSKSETPIEYGQRLSEQYVQLSTEFDTIIKLFCNEIYGQRSLNGLEIIILKKAWKKIKGHIK